MIGRQRARAVAVHDEAPEYWVAYSDLLVSLLMVFALLLFLVLAQIDGRIKAAEAIFRANSAAVEAAMRGLGGPGSGSVDFDPKKQALAIRDEVLFASGSAALKPEAKVAMQKLATGFLADLVTRNGTTRRIESINVEGHTDTVGTYLYNLDLSQRRAQAVMQALVEATDDSTYAPQLRELLVASGRSKVEALRAVEQRTYSADKARRIVLRVRFRNDELLEQLFSQFAR